MDKFLTFFRSKSPWFWATLFLAVVLFLVLINSVGASPVDPYLGFR
jgi:hypothetical protein